ncbi:phospholipase effector Tle1 domain-containing protein [Pseudomonas sp.]|uniref:T6SS phospholipase effector Tle1-like catalytic domain-containing protein n=1 Tax=Pseudomonas sp. TaxID=306 RepID=UPI003D6F3563
MSPVKQPISNPPQFPLLGRLPQRAEQVQANLLRQCEQERGYHDALCLASGYRQPLPCCKTLHISLFFDGTGNNLNNDLYESAITHPTNIARLFRASIGDGHAGGTSHRGTVQGLTDAAGTGNGQYFKYYMPGVGTPFPEVNDLDYSSTGLAFARRGEERINWGLLMIIDALRRTLGQPRLDNTALGAAVEAMGTWPGTEWIMGRANRAGEFRRQLNALERPLRIALGQPQPGQPKLLGIKLYVYGFSRGAAAARAFVNWLNLLLSRIEATPTLLLNDLKLPVSVEYLGLLDTVVSVGLADISPGVTGHMGWGDGSQELPRGNLLKRCLHIVASHEQRLSFPLESIRGEDGNYPANSVEVIYPGVHSDQGGGYPRGDQGKAVGENDGLLLSQIALHDLYADAFAHGAPLKVPKDALPIGLRHEFWRAMEFDVQRSFAVGPKLVDRFNAWRHVTLGLIPASQPLTTEQIERYQVLPATIPLEEALRTQLAWITAWRIDRYAFDSLKNTEFYLAASDKHGTEEVRQRAEAERAHKQAEVEASRKEQKARERNGAAKIPLKPGVPAFDPDKAQTQLREAAEEFGKIYRDLNSDPYLAFLRKAILVNPIALFTYLNSAETIAEREQLKAAGRAKVSQLFPPPSGERNHLTEHFRANVDERSNSHLPEGLLRALFDDQVHDSRAWFLHALLNQSALNVNVAVGREPWGSYFNERMVFFGEANRRDLALMVEPKATTAADRASALASASTTQASLMDAQRRAQVQQDIAAVWEAHYAKLSEVSDGSV